MQTIQRILIAYEVIEKMRPDGTDRDDASERIARDGAEIARAAGFDTTAEVISSTDDPADASAWPRPVERAAVGASTSPHPGIV